MKITILNGENRRQSNSLSAFLSDFTLESSRLENPVHIFNLSEMNLKFCTGCWSCWTKTPGVCSQQDNAEIIFKEVINSDLLIFASPIIAGFTSAELKKITDRLIVLIHPYIQIRNNECHHQKRYEKYPNIGLILELGENTDEEDIQITTDIYKRLALNFHSELKFVIKTDKTNSKQAAHEIINY
ncbi:MAG: NAD(P)H-dependent oxidoreductase [Bacteroidales bacterium]|nr:NAD(P)H-dependent oxidoreductase [Bacteroidales bacterium]